VTAQMLENPWKQLIAPFVAKVVHRRPYVTVKWAQTADGKVAARDGKPIQISNPTSWRTVHELRARSDAILVGIGTVLSDDPLLTARGVAFARPLTRVVLDSVLRTPPGSRLVQTAAEHPLILYYSQLIEPSTVLSLIPGVRMVPVDHEGESRFLSLPAVFADLAHRGVTHLLVEAGPRMGRSFLSQRAADRVWVFESPRSVGDPEAPYSFPVKHPAVATLDLAGDTLTEYLNTMSPVYFAREPSADFVLAAEQHRPS